MATALDISTPPVGVTCFRCGKQYPKYRTYFYTSYAAQHKGVGYMPVCKDCVEAMYSTYLSQCNDIKVAVRQTCRKLDVLWSEDAYNEASGKSTQYTIMKSYLSRLNASSKRAGKSYDDSLLAEGTMWAFDKQTGSIDIQSDRAEEGTDTEPEWDVPDDVVSFWGTGYTPSMYMELEKRREYWMKRMPENVDVGTEALIRQICAAEIDINRYRAEGNANAADKCMNTLNTLLGSASLKPTQQKDDVPNQYDNTPMGVWIKRWEDYRPIPEPDPEFKDENKIVKYISTWFYGHLCKMLNIKNSYCKLYEDEMDKYRVDKPEIDDDEELFGEVFNDEADADGYDEI